MSVEICTGVCDSNGKLIKVGGTVRKPNDINHDIHGRWVEYEIKQQGLTPILSYLRSETGNAIPKGYTGCPLSDLYDLKMFCFAKDPSTLRPEEELVVVS
jgi:hypothetical protein